MGMHVCTSVYVDDIKMAGKQEHMRLMWKKVKSKVDLAEPTPLLDQESLECTHREHTTNTRVVEEKRHFLESGLFEFWVEDFQCSGALVALSDCVLGSKGFCRS